MRAANSLNGAVSVSISRSGFAARLSVLLHPYAGVVAYQCLSAELVVHVSARVLLRDLAGLDAARVRCVVGRSRFCRERCEMC